MTARCAQIVSCCGDMAIRNYPRWRRPHLEFVRTVNSTVRSAVPENPTLEPSGSGQPLQRYGHSRMLGAYGTPVLRGRRGHRGSAMAPLERAMVVSYKLSIVTVALCVTIRPQIAIECLRRSNQQGVGHFGPKFRGVLLGADMPCWGCKERTSQAN